MPIAIIRYVFVLVFLFFLISLFEIQNRKWASRLSVISNGLNYVSKQQPVVHVWSWADRKPHYPLETLVSLPSGPPQQLPQIQHKFGSETISERALRLERQEEVKRVFKRGWDAYRTHAWMHDEVAPLTNEGRNFLGGWAATLVDAMDTLWIMDLKEEFEEAVAAAEKIDFTVSSDDSVNVFETTIRFLGGFLAAYDLSEDSRLLRKAKEVGEMLLVPFDTPNHLPITRWEWQAAKDGEITQEAPESMLISELGSLSMEFTRLSQITNDTRWYDAVDRITRLLETHQDNTKLPGMWPVGINPKEEDLVSDSSFSLGGMSDSLYEYFPKEYALLGGLEPVYRSLYEKSMTTAMQHLLFYPMTPDGQNIALIGEVQSHNDGLPPVLEPKSQHLTCFVGGMLALGSKLFENDEHLALAEKVTNGCIWAYNATSVGVMPEIAEFVPCPGQQPCAWDEEKWTVAVESITATGGVSQERIDMGVEGAQVPQGYVAIHDPRYLLRPEALESVFYMYRITGNQAYMDHAWDMFSAIQFISETESANAAITDITAVDEQGLPPKEDRMESFWLAETLKYAYLTFSEPKLISLDDYVFNTEAHPFKIPK